MSIEKTLLVLGEVVALFGLVVLVVGLLVM
jgi:hypothetical protein